MKFLIILNNDFDGVGQPAINLSSNLKKKGHKTKIIVLHKKSENKDVIKIKRSFISRIFLFILRFLMKDSLDLFGFGYSTVKYSDIEEHVEESDVIIIYTFYKIISNKILSQILNTKKIIYFRPLDIELATGGCHFNETCQKFKSDCKHCPRLHFDLFNLPNENLIKKKEIFEYFKPLVFVQNNYVKNIFKKSNVFKNIKTQTVYLGANQNRSKFYSKKDARKMLKINHNEKIVLFGAFNLASRVKGGQILIDSLKLFELKYLKNKQKKIFSKNIRLLTIGEKNTFNLDTDIIKWTHLGKVESDKKLNLLYRAADVLVCPSLYCFGPHIVTEALLNDLPVVAFDSGIAQDSIVNGLNGYLVPCYNNSIFAKSIYKILSKTRNNKINNKVRKIKNFCSSNYEANTIIKKATSDLKIKKRDNIERINY